jgi:hypothetical protein
MKRGAKVIEEKQWDGPSMPTDVIGDIFQHVKPQTVSEIFGYILVCRTALKSLPSILVPWIKHIMELKEKPYVKGQPIDENKIVLNCLTNHGKERGLFPIVLKKLVTSILDGICDDSVVNALRNDDGILAVFDLYKFALLEKHWLLSKKKSDEEEINNVNHNKWWRSGQMPMICQRYHYRFDTKIREVFYHDKQKGVVIPLKRVAGLRTAEIPGNRDHLEKEVRRIALERCNDDKPMTEIVKIGLSRLSGKTDELLALYHKMMGKNLVTHKPHKGSLVRNCYINDSTHLFDSSNPIFSNLYICQYRKMSKQKDYPECNKAYVLQQYLSNDDRFKEIWKRFGVIKDNDSSSSFFEDDDSY